VTGNETEADDFRDEERTEAMEKACLDIMEICHEHTECAIDGPVILHRKMQCLRDISAYPFYDGEPPYRYGEGGKRILTGEHSRKRNCQAAVAERILELIKRLAEIDAQ
jgi:hypothetical protein